MWWPPADHGWDTAQQAWNLAADQRPALVVAPADAADVAAVIEFARSSGLRVAAQGTGHNASGIASLEDTILLSTRRMRGVGSTPRRGLPAWRPARLRPRSPRGHGGRTIPAHGLVARHRRRRLHACRRSQLARAQARVGRQPRHGDRGRHARRRPSADDRVRGSRALLGPTGRRRQLWSRHRARARPASARRALRRHVPVALRAPRRGARCLVRLDRRRARRAHDMVPTAPSAAVGRPASVPQKPLGRRDRRHVRR
jgi:hypothetical protein